MDEEKRTFLFPCPTNTVTLRKVSDMTMRILLVEDKPSLTRMYKIAFREHMPEAQLDVVASVGGYLRTAAETRYDAYILDDGIADGRSAFRDIAPRIIERFPDAVLLHNSGNSHPADISNAERFAKIRFARGPGGEVLTCDKNPMLAIEYIRAMLVRKGMQASRTFGPPCQTRRFETRPKQLMPCCCRP